MNFKHLVKLLLFMVVIGNTNFNYSQSYKVACLNDYPPYSSVSDDREISGFLMDWWDLWSKKTGIEIEFVPGSIDDCKVWLDNNEVDIMSGGFYSEELSGQYDFGDQILATEALLCIKNRFDPLSIDSINFVVSHVRNGFSGNYIKENHSNLELRVFDSNHQLYEAVDNQEVEAFVYIIPSSILGLVNISIPKGYKKFEILFSNNLRPIVKKGNEKVLADILKGSESISAEDLLVLAKKWNVFKNRVVVNKILIYGVIVGFVLLLIAILFFLKRYRSRSSGALNDVSFNLEEEINKGESDFLEFKSSLRWDYQKNIKNKILELVVAKTISAFLNSRGGMLLIGVDDDGEILGLENDYNSLSKNNKDGFVLTLTTLINNTLGKEFHKFINIKVFTLNDKDVCAIQVGKSNSPVFMIKGEKEEFFIRASASSQPLGLKNTMAYIQSHWRNRN